VKDIYLDYAYRKFMISSTQSDKFFPFNESLKVLLLTSRSGDAANFGNDLH